MNTATSVTNRARNPRRIVTLLLCVLVLASLLMPYANYPVARLDEAGRAAQLVEAQAAYEEAVAAYQLTKEQIAAAKEDIAAVQPLYDEVKANIADLEAADEPDADAIAAAKDKFDALNERLVEARKLTRQESGLYHPVPVQDPPPMSKEALRSAEAETVQRISLSGLDLVRGKLSAANNIQLQATLIPGMVLLAVAVILFFVSATDKWRRLAVFLGAVLVIFSALRLVTASGRELGPIADTYHFAWGYTLAVLASLAAIVLSGMEEKRVDLSLPSIRKLLNDKAIYLVLLLLVAVIGIIRPNFFSVNTMINILQQSSTRLIIAMGMCLVIIGTGGVDLSAGRVVGMTAVISSSMLQTSTYSRQFFPGIPALPVIVPFALAVLVALLFGAANGLLVSKLSVPPFIATLAAQVIIYGATSIYFDMAPNNSQPIGGLREDFTFLGSGSIYGFIPIVFIIALVVVALIWFMLNKTVFGKNVYAIGGNVEAARVSGINVAKTILIIFAVCSALIGMAGVLEAARTGGATNNYGVGYELDAIAASVVGGVSSSGGVGTIAGVVSGVLIFQVINYGLTFLGVNPYWQQIIKGIIIASAVALDIRKYLTRK